MFQEDISLVYKIAREIAKEEIALAAAAPAKKASVAAEVEAAPAEEIPAAEEEDAPHKKARL